MTVWKHLLVASSVGDALGTVRVGIRGDGLVIVIGGHVLVVLWLADAPA
ncbi:hypothetical protein [Novosphingobium sp.]|nr:hypothetical protein [Novosphingobium sp.]